MATLAEAREVIEGIVAKIVAEYKPQKIILFGSYAYGMPQFDSDIDLLIIKETPERFIDRWVAVRRIVSDPKRRTPVEPLVLTPRELSRRLAIGDQFIAQIMGGGEVLYSASDRTSGV